MLKQASKCGNSCDPLKKNDHPNAIQSEKTKKLGERRTIVAVAGQPNTGKSTVFNKLTGLRQRVGNWPGKTVDRMEGEVERGERSCLFVDLPGVYGLTAHSMEEEITRDYLLSGVPDVVMVVADAAGLERSLYFVLELLLLDIPVVIALNMMDVAVQEGRKVNPRIVSDITGVAVIPMVGTDRNQSMDDLFDAIDASDTVPSKERNIPQFPDEIERIARLIDNGISVPYPRRWTALKLLEGDHAIRIRVESKLDAGHRELLNHALENASPSLVRNIYRIRREWIDKIFKEAVTIEDGGISPTDRWDKIFLHPIWGRIIAFTVIPAGSLLGMILGMFTGGMVLMGALSSVPHIKSAWPGTIGSLVASALVPAIGWIIALVSIIGFIYAIFHFLEDTGYLARAAYLMDSMLRWIGVDGKSAIPLLMGMLCNTVAIAGSRVVNTRRQRLITLSMLPFLPCFGQTGVAFFFAFALFPFKTAILVIIGVMSVNIALACMAGGVVNRRLSHLRAKGLVMELPLYHKPNFRTILSGVRTRVEIFARNTAGYILAALIVVWAVSYYPDGAVETSYLYRLGRVLEPLGTFFGFEWRFVVALLSSFVAKETTVGTLAVLFSVGANDHQAIVQAVQSSITPQGALAFIVISNLYLPCVATITALKSEFGSWLVTAGLLLIMLVIAISAALAVYQVTSLLI